MATMIFNDQENGDVTATLLSKDRVRLPSAGKRLVQSQQGKVFASVPGEKASRKALGNVNKQVMSQKPVQPLKGGHKVKKPAPAATKVAEASLKTDKQCYPEIEKFIPYNPADFDIFDVPEEHKLSCLSLAGVGLMANEADSKRLASLLSLELAPVDIPAFGAESGADSLPAFLATLEEITVEMPPMQC
ncbi:securin-like [Eleutherodactylus coqui]|uniref:securin-like n=1 Tax=Eleutherodactylus coqui TaxID=57060 RepID=UPI003461E43B